MAAKVRVLLAKTILIANFTFIKGTKLLNFINITRSIKPTHLNRMQKFYLLLVSVFVCCTVSLAQTDSLSKKDKASLDSMMRSDEFLKLMKDKEKNSLELSIGFGNGAFSSNNQAANATGYTDQLIYTPAVLYRTKTGFSFGLTGYLTNDSSNRVTLYQTGASAAYEHYGEEVTVSVSYTRYLTDTKKYNNKSVYQNDFYSYIKKAKGIIQPGVALGFANGQYKESNLASFILHRPLNPRGDTLIVAIDSTDNKSSYFSISPYIEHDFSFYKLFAKDDQLDFTPSFIVNFGSDKFTQTHTNKLFNRPAFSKRKKVEGSNKLQVQSVAGSIDLSYTVGKFYLEPTLYMDYYLPQTTAKRLTTIYCITAGITF
jgi:hypothetical protein